MVLKAPFPWFGGKRRVAHVVWEAFGPDVNNYVEPFAGSLAVLLGRPGGEGKCETANDKDAYLSNFWRALQADPEGVAKWADWPVNEADLVARNRWLIKNKPTYGAMIADPEFYDVKLAGWWVWGVCAWFGRGWTEGRSATNVSCKLPLLSRRGQGIHAKLPYLTTKGRGIHNVSSEINSEGPAFLPTFHLLQKRLRRVRIACGDWRRVVSPSVLGISSESSGLTPCAVFLDPPYSNSLRCERIYSEDDVGIADEVRAWAIENGDNPSLRIALCGYEGEHAMPSGWQKHVWRAGCCFNSKADNANRTKERIWLSPHCLTVGSQGSISFSEESGAPLCSNRKGVEQ